MGDIREVFDVKQYPLKYGEPTELEKVVQALETMLVDLYEEDMIDCSGRQISGYKTKQGTRFFVNAVYEWNAVFLEYADGEDGSRISLDECHSVDEIFHKICIEIENE